MVAHRAGVCYWHQYQLTPIGGIALEKTRESEYLTSNDLESTSTDFLATFPATLRTESLNLRFTKKFPQTLAEFSRNDANSAQQALGPQSLGTAHLPTIPLSSSLPIFSPPTYLHAKRKGEKSIVDPSIVSRAFTDTSSQLNIERRALLEEILGSPFYLNQEHEPQLGTFDAELVLLVGDMSTLASIAPRKGSIFSLFIDMDAMMCLFCDQVHRSVERVIGCVRSHIGHRPFACGGGKDGCKSCTESRFARFFSRSYLRDHITKPKNPDRCPSCNASIHIGGIRRHYESVHPAEPFPDMKTHRKRERRGARRGRGSPLSFSPY
ncbi:hypothetical protein FRB91_003214 [Serendipita sp. 411]|nr:hypothetical protein FRB91_003214 [Serendipita sp. 411]